MSGSLVIITRFAPTRIAAWLFVLIFGLGLALATLGLGSFVFAVVIIVGFVVGILLAFIGRAVVLIIPTRARTALFALGVVTAILDVVFVVTVIVRLTPIIVALGARFVLPRLVVGDHAEVMIGKLQIIFGLNPVAIVLGVLSKLLVLVEKLRRIATCPAVNPVLIASTALVVAVSATAATIVTIVIQRKFILIRGQGAFSMVRLNSPWTPISTLSDNTRSHARVSAQRETGGMTQTVR